MSSQAEELVGAFLSLDGLGVLRRRWLLSAKPLIARAQRELSDDERVLDMAVGENPHGQLEAVLVTEQRICVIGQHDVRWFARQGIWETSSTAAGSAPGEALRLYGDSWELSWTQLRPPSAGEQIRQRLTERRPESERQGGLPAT